MRLWSFAQRSERSELSEPIELMALPEEIIVKILEFTCEPDKHNFKNLASTCRSVRKIFRGHQFADYFKCQNCTTIDISLKNDHLTCYKWHFNKMTQR